MVTKRIPAKKPARRQEPRPKKEPLSLWERLAAIGEEVPNEVWDKLPRYLAKNFDHYAHGSPRQD